MKHEKKYIAGPEWMTVAAYWQKFEAAIPTGTYTPGQIHSLKAIFYGGATSTTNICKRLLMEVRDGEVDANAAIWKTVALEKEVLDFLGKDEIE